MITIKQLTPEKAVAEENGAFTEIQISPSGYQPSVTSWLQHQAAGRGRPINAMVNDADGTYPLIVHPNGVITDAMTISPMSIEQPPRSAPTGPTPASQPASNPPAPVSHLQPPQNQAMGSPMDNFSFLEEKERPALAQEGWRGRLNDLGFKLAPNATEIAHIERRNAIRQGAQKPRIIAVVNGKGGAGKTPTTLLLSQILSEIGQTNVLAWDLNPTRGTLGWRSHQAHHDATIATLLADLDQLQDPTTSQATISQYIHRQSATFAVLRSQPDLLSTQQALTPESVDPVLAVLKRYFSTFVLDTGNDESSPLWQKAIDVADQIVVPTTTRQDSAESARLLLDSLATQERTRHLAQTAVVVVSRAAVADPEPGPIVEQFRTHGTTALPVRHDPMIGERWLDFNVLKLGTQDQWLDVAADIGMK